MDTIPRVRFALSSSGSPHVNHLHVALFGWALARSLDGDLILRIDGDVNHAQHDALNWLGVDWDEQPKRQSAHYLTTVTTLIECKAAYKDGGAIRLRLSSMNNPILIHADGRVAQPLASAVDDHDMEITHVVSHTQDAPTQLAIYNALDWQPPKRVYLPPALTQQQQPLPTRGYQVRDFQQAGFLPQALWNYLLQLNWASPSAQKLLTKWTVRQKFRVDALLPHSSIFDWETLRAINQQCIQTLGAEALAAHLRDFVEDAYGALPSSNRWLLDLTTAVRDELVVLEDVIDSAEWAFDPPEPTVAANAALRTPAAKPALTHLLAELASVVLLDHATGNSILKSLCERLNAQHGWDAAQVMLPIRAALIGRTDGAALSQVLGILGKQRSIERIAAALRQ